MLQVESSSELCISLEVAMNEFDSNTSQWSKRFSRHNQSRSLIETSKYQIFQDTVLSGIYPLVLS